MTASQIEALTDNIYFILVSLLTDKHGYLIMQSIEEVTGGAFVIGPASLYTNLKKLLKAGLIHEKPGEKSNQKVYAITARGVEALKSEVKRREQMVILAKRALATRNGGEER
ncbi:MAG TPA: PadR family transcriptional regulator [Limnochordia bacterium]|nr:PadR family transcriptional regulator [Limnochordia bacterium]